MPTVSFGRIDLISERDSITGRLKYRLLEVPEVRTMYMVLGISGPAGLPLPRRPRQTGLQGSALQDLGKTLLSMHGKLDRQDRQTDS